MTDAETIKLFLDDCSRGENWDMRLIELCRELLSATNFQLRYFENPLPAGTGCPDCDTGGSGYATNGDGWHDDKEPHVCAQLLTFNTLTRAVRIVRDE